MNNREVQAAWNYHDGTKHSYWSIRNRPHFLDWANRPLPFKIYPKIEPLPLPRDVRKQGWPCCPQSQKRCLRCGLIPSLVFRIWHASCISQQGLPNSVHIQVEKSTFAPQLAPELSTRSNCTS